MAMVDEPAEATEKAVGQWVTEVLDYSTEYGNPGWAAFQVVGPPNVFPALIDSADSWTPLEYNNGAEYLVVRVDRPVRIEQVLVWETLTPGAIVRISALPLTHIEAVESGVLGGPAKPQAIATSYRGSAWIQATASSGTPRGLPAAGWELLWSAPTQYQQQTAARIFQPQLHRNDVVSQVVKIELNTYGASYWPEIDAVQIRGYPISSDQPFDDLHHIYPVLHSPTQSISCRLQHSSPICRLPEYCLSSIASHLPLSSLARLSQACKVLNTVLRSDHFFTSRISRLRILAIDPDIAPLFGNYAVDGPPAEQLERQPTFTSHELLKAFGEAMLFRPSLALCLHSGSGGTCACPPGADLGRPSVGPRVEMPQMLGFEVFGPEFTVDLWFRVAAAEPEGLKLNGKTPSEAQRGIGGTLFGYQSSAITQFVSLYVGEDGFLRKILSFSDPRTLEGPFVADGHWHHVAISCTPTAQRMYVDGVLADRSQPTGVADIIPQLHWQIGTGLVSSATPGRPTYVSFAQRFTTGTGLRRSLESVRTELLLDGAHWFPFAGDIMEARVWHVAVKDAAEVRAMMQVAVVGNNDAFDQTGSGERGGDAGAPHPSFATAPREFAKRFLVARVAGAHGCRFAGNAEPVGRGALLRKAVTALGSRTQTRRRRRPPAIDGVDDRAIEAVLQRPPGAGPKIGRGGFVAFGVASGFVGTPWEVRQ